MILKGADSSLENKFTEDKTMGVRAIIQNIVKRIRKVFRTKKVVILTGAGAAIPWGGSSTNKITQMIRDDRDFKVKTGEPLGEYLFLLLTKIYKDKENINFETIIDLLEVLYDYYNGKERGGRTHFKSNLTALFNVLPDIEDNIFDYDKIYKKDSNPGLQFYCSEIKGIPFLPKPKVSYLKTVYVHFINIILSAVEQYCDPDSVKKYVGLNKGLCGFLRYFRHAKVRFYTTNYDQIPFDLSCLNFYTGFDRVPRSASYSLNIEKIASDRYKHSLFNLHGCAHFDFAPIYNNDDDLLGLEWVWTPGKVIKLSIGTSDGKDQSRRALMHSNIVAGLYKTSRIIIQPQYSYYQKLLGDCLDADLIITIGYSYNDFHINQALKAAYKSKQQKIVDITYIDKWFKNDPYIHERVWSIHEESLVAVYQKEFRSDSAFKSGAGWVRPVSGDIQIYWKGFKSYLDERQWEEIKI